MNQKHNTLGAVLRRGKEALLGGGIENATPQGQRLLMEAGGFSRVDLVTKEDIILSDEVISRYESYVRERLTHRPLQYILGTWEFMGLPFFVGEGVLIPRGDTEILVETVLEIAKKEKLKTIVDVGCGSGCIPISLVHYGAMEAVGLDISPTALAFARKNGAENNVSIQWLESDLFSALSNMQHHSFDAIVSNPPYIACDVVETLAPEVRLFEPRNALEGGMDGLDFYRRIIKESTQWLRNEGYLFFEIGYDQGQALLDMMEEAGFSSCEGRRDLSGLDRVVFGQYKRTDKAANTADCLDGYEKMR